MKVIELAEKLKTTSEDILKMLKAMKLKAKDENQELNSVVLTVLKTEYVKRMKASYGRQPKKAEKDKKIDMQGASENKTEEVPKTEKEEKKEEKKEKKKTSKKKISTKKDSAETEKVSKTKPEKKEVKEKADVKEKEEIKKAAPKKKIPAPEVKKPRRKISNEPVITLKPLARKKRKISTPDDKQKQTDSGSLNIESPVSFNGPDMQVFNTVPSSQEIQGPLTDMEVKVPITVKDLSVKLMQKPSAILSRLMKIGLFCHINQSLDGEIIERIAKDFGFNLIKIKTQEEQLIESHKQADEDPSLLKPRAPVVTFMGHVDHGKTSLLDRIRKSKVADNEHGGITQHMGAYSVKTDRGLITFLDTPGHEAFTAMRSRGAHITDIVILVVAADEGVMPQTEEAIDHARAANVPIVVALNKIDRKNADSDRVKKQLADRELKSEDWGGNTIVTNVSAVTGEGVNELLEMILLESEMLELKANPDKNASGIVVEANLSQGKGAVTTLIVQSGTLKEGDYIVVGPYCGKVRAMFNDNNKIIKHAGPSMPVKILGLSSVPEAGDSFYVVDTEKQSREIIVKRQEHLKNKRLGASTRVTLEDLYSQLQEGSVKELNVVMKADVQGSLEALKDSLEKIPSDKVKIRFIHLGIGDVNASDVILAVASKAIIIAFHVAIDNRAKEELEKESVDVRQYRIIYDAVNDVKNALEGLLEAKTRKEFQSRIEVRQVFKLSKHGIVAGCYVLKGKVNRKSKIDVIRDGKVIYSGSISSLKRFKDDVRDVSEGMECGITIQGFDKVLQGDILETYDLIKIAQTL